MAAFQFQTQSPEKVLLFVIVLTLFQPDFVTWRTNKGWFRPWPVGIGLTTKMRTFPVTGFEIGTPWLHFTLVKMEYKKFDLDSLSSGGCNWWKYFLHLFWKKYYFLHFVSQGFSQTFLGFSSAEKRQWAVSSVPIWISLKQWRQFVAWEWRGTTEWTLSFSLVKRQLSLRCLSSFSGYERTLLL